MKLISLNIEGSKHLERIIPFITKESPDVLCLQEVFKADLHLFEKLGYTCHFLPLTIFMINENPQEHGVALCSKTRITDVKSIYYLDFETVLPLHDPKDIPLDPGWYPSWHRHLRFKVLCGHWLTHISH